MSRERIEKELYHYGRLKKMVREYERELQDEMARKEAFLEGQLKAPPPDSVRVQGGERQDPVYNAVCVLMEVHDERIGRIRERLLALYGEYDDVRMAFHRAGLNEQEATYIRCRYEEGRSVGETAMRMRYSESRLRQVRAALMEKLENVGWKAGCEGGATGGAALCDGG